MLDEPNRELNEVLTLLKAPTGNNVTAATRKLERIASQFLAFQGKVSAGQIVTAQEKQDLIEFREQFERVRNLLESSAKFFNRLSGLRQVCAYQRDGLFAADPGARRTLARL